MQEMKSVINYDFYKPEPNQELIHRDEHLYRVVCAGRKFGKSVLARQELVMNAIYHKEPKRKGIYQPAHFWIVSPTIKQGRLNHWRQLIAEIPHDLIKKKRGGLAIDNTNMEIELGHNGAIISIVGAENADRIRGAGVIGMVIDEAAYIPKQVWEMVLEPELYSTKGWALFISTPKGPNWYKDLWERGQKKGGDWKSYKFTSYQTPRAKDKVRAEFLKEKQLASAPETFAQEYLADFTKLEGLIYKEFDIKKHVIEPFDIPIGIVGYRSIDWGAKNPTAVLFVAPLADGRIIVYDEIYETDITTADLADKIRAKSYNRRFGNTFADPSGRQRIMDLDMTYKIPTEKALRETSTTKKNWVNLGIDKVKEKLMAKLKDNKPALQVFNTCENFIREIGIYSWKEMPVKTSEVNHPGIPENANNHAMDALRYFMVSYRGPVADDEEIPDDTAMFDDKGMY